MTEIPYKLAGFGRGEAPKGKIPYVELDGRLLGDSQLIIDELERRLVGDSKRALDLIEPILKTHPDDAGLLTVRAAARVQHISSQCAADTLVRCLF